MPDYLNPTLHRRLVLTFKMVRVTNLGQENVVYRRAAWNQKGRMQSDVVTHGEQYSVSCPFCSDTRQRLSINYSWAVKDEESLDLMQVFDPGLHPEEDDIEEHPRPATNSRSIVPVRRCSLRPASWPSMFLISSGAGHRTGPDGL